MKIKEEFIDGEGDTFHIKKTYDFNPALERARLAREVGHKMGDMTHIGSIPMGLVEIWAKQAGISMQDNAALSEVIKRNLQNGEFSKFRNYEGTY